ncbi:bifunctional diaminohydroxyphosphoribosylaminopyrimidine deaminase/5-amino-6-(5-phosphoribosylamino)uracil reductase RibD [Devosia sp.]|uniref:bifunctional diaminohydroxyphosphoribosylaminopyrimidine deaminase/5-amino-6-(5-phosphoribosylamino)uracil reductase RibD n=1 Tax=Devosia sp. TaxID=1871048 RepID=UPI0037C03882
MTQLSGSDRRWLDAAARLARSALGASPGHLPAAALIVDEELQLLFGRGITGRTVPFAEPQAVEEARGTARGRTLYTTLEPTSLWGRTPPSTEAIIKAKLARVVIGCANPDHSQSGQGIVRLRSAGIDVLLAEHEPSHRLYAADRLTFAKNRPFVTGKLLVSRDGMIGRSDTKNAVPGGPQAQRFVEMLRATSDGTMIGAQAAKIDDPKLFVRIKGLDTRIYQRFVVVGARGVDTELNLIAGVSGHPTAIISVSEREFDVPDAVDIIVTDGRNGRPDLSRAMAAITARGVVNLLVEGGSKLIEGVIAAELMDRFHLIQTDSVTGRGGIPATMLGGIDGRLRAAGLVEVDQRTLGPDKLRTFERER